MFKPAGPPSSWRPPSTTAMPLYIIHASRSPDPPARPAPGVRRQPLPSSGWTAGPGSTRPWVSDGRLTPGPSRPEAAIAIRAEASDTHSFLMDSRPRDSGSGLTGSRVMGTPGSGAWTRDPDLPVPGCRGAVPGAWSPVTRETRIPGKPGTRVSGTRVPGRQGC